MSARQFWGDYESNASPAHFAKIKSIHSGKPEIVAHRGQAAHSAEYDNVSADQLERHARQAQDFLAAAHPDSIKMVRGVPHITLYRGIHGKYAEKILSKFGAHKYRPEPGPNHSVDAKRVSASHLPFSSWTLDPGVAEDFAAYGAKPHALVFKKDFPLSDVLHAGFGKWYEPQEGEEEGAPQHYHDAEKEVAVRHKDNRLGVSHKNLHKILVPGSYGRYKSAAVADKNTPKVEKSETDLEKMSKPGFKFPGLGVGDDRRETPVVSTDLQYATKSAAIRNAADQAAKKDPWGYRNIVDPKGQDEGLLHAVRSKMNIVHPRRGDYALAREGNKPEGKIQEVVSAPNPFVGGAVTAFGGTQGYVAGDEPIRRGIEAHIHPFSRPEAIRQLVGRDWRGTKLHEDFHQMMNRVQNRYGHQARKNLAANLWRWGQNRMATQHKDLAPHAAVEATLRATYPNIEGQALPHEEKLATLVTWLNSARSRENAHHKVYGEAPYQSREAPAKSRDYLKTDRYMKQLYGHIADAASKISDERWLSDPKEFNNHLMDHELGGTSLLGKSEEDLEKGLKGDWQQEGYEIRHTVDPDGKHISVSAHLGDRKVGELDAGHSQAYPGTLHPTMVKVHEAHQRKGLGTAMYQRAEQVLGKPFSRGGYQSPEAKKLWAQKGRPFGKSEAHDNMAQHGIAELLHHSHDRKQKLLALKHRGVTPWELKIALHDEDPEIREAAALHPNADDSVRNYIAEGDDEELKALLTHPQGLSKDMAPILFPKLGEGRIHTRPMLMGHESYKNLSSEAARKDLGYARATVATNEEMPGEERILRGAVNTSKPRLKDPVARGRAIAGTEGHETQHLIFRRLDQRYGRANATPKVLAHLYAALDDTDKRALAGMFAAAGTNSKGELAYSKDKFKEETVAHLQQYLQDPHFRNKVHAKLKPTLEASGMNERDFHSKIKGVYKKMRATAESLTPEHLGVVSKSDAEVLRDFAEKLQKNHATMNDDAVLENLGVSVELANYIKAVEFLTGKPVDEREVRRRMHTHDLSAAEATLDVAGCNTEDSVKAVEAVVAIDNVKKSDKDHEVRPFMPSGEEYAEDLRYAFANNQVTPVKLQGKHSSGAELAKDKDGGYLLLKPGSGKLSPAAGIRQETASQSRREAAFYAVAKLLGLANSLPHTESIFIDGDEYAVMEMLPPHYHNVYRMTKSDAGLTRRLFEPLRLDGTLARWAALDWICANSDRHGQNLMFSPTEDGGYDVKLIDHGSTFAGSQFNPANDSDGSGGFNSFVPYYLRYTAPKGKFHELTREQQLRFMPQTPEDLLPAFKAWLEEIDPQQLEELLVSFGISPDPALQRLAQLKVAVDGGFDALNGLWLKAPSERPSVGATDGLSPDQK